MGAPSEYTLVLEGQHAGIVDTAAMKGYLYKFSRKRWSLKWVVIKNNTLKIYKDPKEYWRTNLKFTLPETKPKRRHGDYELLSCAIRTLDKPPFAFELIQNSGKSSIKFRAENEADYKAWISAIQNSIMMVTSASDDSKSKRMTLMPNGAAIAQLMKEISNQSCADCSRSSPNWVSLSTGAIICAACAEIHTTFPGFRVKCLTMDVLPAITVNYLLQLPNSIVNDIYENSVNFPKPNINSTNEEWAIWISEKYQKKRFVEPFTGLKIELHQALVDSIQHEDVPTFMKLVAQGANPQPITCEGVHVLHLAIEEGLSMMVEAILEVGVDVNLPDKADGRTGIFFAIDEGHFEIAKLLISGHNASLTVQSVDGYDPLSYALAIAQEEPENPIHMEIYYYILRKVNQGSQRSYSEIGQVNLKTQRHSNPKTKPTDDVEIDIPTISQTGDSADSRSSEESISLSDYL
jgi:hypothetical protein